MAAEHLSRSTRLRRPAAAALLTGLLLATLPALRASPAAQAEAGRGADAITLRPSAVAELIGQIGGHPVRVPGARIFWVIDSRALVVESDTRLEPVRGNRDRLLVLVERGSLVIPRPPVATSPVTIVGVARTLLGAQADSKTAWPPALTPEMVGRLEIRAAVVASSIRTADGIDLTSGPGTF